MEAEEKVVVSDSLRPLASNTEPRTIRPVSIKTRKAHGIIAVLFLTLMSSVFIYVLLFDSKLGDMRIYCGLMAFLVFVCNIASIYTLALLLAALEKMNKL